MIRFQSFEDVAEFARGDRLRQFFPEITSAEIPDRLTQADRLSDARTRRTLKDIMVDPTTRARVEKLLREYPVRQYANYLRAKKGVKKKYGVMANALSGPPWPPPPSDKTWAGQKRIKDAAARLKEESARKAAEAAKAKQVTPVKTGHGMGLKTKAAITAGLSLTAGGLAIAHANRGKKQQQFQSFDDVAEFASLKRVDTPYVGALSEGEDLWKYPCLHIDGLDKPMKLPQSGQAVITYDLESSTQNYRGGTARHSATLRIRELDPLDDDDQS
jgi:hypothetical protein